MRATFLLAASAAGMFAMSGAVFAQDMQMQTAPDQSKMSQQSTQSDMTSSSYGGVPATTRASGMSQSTWTSGSSSACITGLSCNIYQGN